MTGTPDSAATQSSACEAGRRLLQVIRHLRITGLIRCSLPVLLELLLELFGSFVLPVLVLVLLVLRRLRRRLPVRLLASRLAVPGPHHRQRRGPCRAAAAAAWRVCALLHRRCAISAGCLARACSAYRRGGHAVVHALVRRRIRLGGSLARRGPLLQRVQRALPQRRLHVQRLCVVLPIRGPARRRPAGAATAALPAAPGRPHAVRLGARAPPGRRAGQALALALALVAARPLAVRLALGLAALALLRPRSLPLALALPLLLPSLPAPRPAAALQGCSR